MEATEWSQYGTESGNPKCANCMVHSGYEASGVDHTFSSLAGLLATAKATLFTGHKDQEALKTLAEPVRPLFAQELVQLGSQKETQV